MNFPSSQHKTKEFNSSSDTYNSDQDQDEIKLEKSDDFQRNFSFDTSQDVAKTITKPIHVQGTPVTTEKAPVDLDDGFTFGKTPLTSTTDLSPEKKRTSSVDRTMNSSPSKSIMKKRVMIHHMDHQQRKMSFSPC